MSDVVITGCSSFTAAGTSYVEVRERLASLAAEAQGDGGSGETSWPRGYARVPDYDVKSRIPRRSDQRVMGRAMLHAVCCAGDALEDAGLKEKSELLDRVGLIVACRTSERDVEVDQRVYDRWEDGSEPDADLNAVLMGGLRPTLFLAQLPNLLTANVSIVHGVRGTSLTFMGEEMAGVDAFETAWHRIASGQDAVVLVGGATDVSTDDDYLEVMSRKGLHTGASPESIWQGGIVIGEGAAFVVLEDEHHARDRGARILAKVTELTTSYLDGAEDPTAAAWEKLAPWVGHRQCLYLASASGSDAATYEERRFLGRVAEDHPGLAVRTTTRATGALLEAAFVHNLVVGLFSMGRGWRIPNVDRCLGDVFEGREAPEAPDQLIVSCWGHRVGRALLAVERADA